MKVLLPLFVTALLYFTFSSLGLAAETPLTPPTEPEQLSSQPAAPVQEKPATCDDLLKPIANEVTRIQNQIKRYEERLNEYQARLKENEAALEALKAGRTFKQRVAEAVLGHKSREYIGQESPLLRNGRLYTNQIDEHQRRIEGLEETITLQLQKYLRLKYGNEYTGLDEYIALNERALKATSDYIENMKGTIRGARLSAALDGVRVLISPPPLNSLSAFLQWQLFYNSAKNDDHYKKEATEALAQYIQARGSKTAAANLTQSLPKPFWGFKFFDWLILDGSPHGDPFALINIFRLIYFVRDLEKPLTEAQTVHNQLSVEATQLQKTIADYLCEARQFCTLPAPASTATPNETANPSPTTP